MSAIARPPGRHYVIIILLRADLSSVDGRRAPGHHSPGSQRGIRGGTAMPGPPPPPPPLTEPAVCRTGLNNIYHGPSGAPTLNWSSGATHGSGPASTPNVTHNRPDQIRLCSLSLIPISLSLSFRNRYGKRCDTFFVGEDCDRMWARVVCRSLNAIALWRGGRDVRGV